MCVSVVAAGAINRTLGVSRDVGIVDDAKVLSYRIVTRVVRVDRITRRYLSVNACTQYAKGVSTISSKK